MRGRDLLELCSAVKVGEVSAPKKKNLSLCSAPLPVEKAWKLAQTCIVREEYRTADAVLADILSTSRERNMSSLYLAASLLKSRIELVCGDFSSASERYKELISSLHGGALRYRGIRSFNSEFLDSLSSLHRPAERGGDKKAELSRFVIEEYYQNIARFPGSGMRREERLFYDLVYIHFQAPDGEEEVHPNYGCLPIWFRESYISFLTRDKNGKKGAGPEEVLQTYSQMKNRKDARKWKRYEWIYGRQP
jgi:hypothetical protein